MYVCMYEVAAFLCHVIAIMNTVKLYACLSVFNQHSHLFLLKKN